MAYEIFAGNTFEGHTLIPGIESFLTQCKKITDARLINKLTGKVLNLRTSIPDDMTNLLTKLNLPH